MRRKLRDVWEIMMSNYIRLTNNLENLKLSKIQEIIPSYLDENHDKSLIDCLLDLTDAEIAFRDERAS